MLRTTARLFYANLRSFTVLEELNAHLSKHRFSHVLVYFRSTWNPQCEITDQHVDRLVSQHRFLEVVKVDSDLAPKIAKHYGARSEP